VSSAFAENRSSVWKTCIQNITSFVVMDRVCESVFVAILTQAVFCTSAIGQSGPCGFNVLAVKIGLHQASGVISYQVDCICGLGHFPFLYLAIHNQTR